MRRWPPAAARSAQTTTALLRVVVKPAELFVCGQCGALMDHSGDLWRKAAAGAVFAPETRVLDTVPELLELLYQGFKPGEN